MWDGAIVGVGMLDVFFHVVEENRHESYEEVGGERAALADARVGGGKGGEKALLSYLEIVVVVNGLDDLQVMRGEAEAAEGREKAGDGKFVEGHFPIDKEEVKRLCGGFI